MNGLTPRLTGAGARSAEGTNTDHENGEAMASVGVCVEPTVRLRREVEGFCSAQNWHLMVLRLMCKVSIFHN